MSTNRGWIGVDLDGTLAHYDGWKGVEHIGKPVEPMLRRVKTWLAQGKDVRIFTARVYIPTVEEVGGQEAWEKAAAERALAMMVIFNWCEEHIGQILPVTCIKDFGMIELWDDRAIQVVPNMGEPLDPITAMNRADS